MPGASLLINTVVLVHVKLCKDEITREFDRKYVVRVMSQVFYGTINRFGSQQDTNLIFCYKPNINQFPFIIW